MRKEYDFSNAIPFYLRKPVERFAFAVRLIHHFGIGLIWTDQPAIAHIAYLQETNEIVINRKLWKKGPAWVKGKGWVVDNLDMATFALFHELGHAIAAAHGAKPGSRSVDMEEEYRCDEFAIDMCKTLLMKSPQMFAAYLNGNYKKRV